MFFMLSKTVIKKISKKLVKTKKTKIKKIVLAKCYFYFVKGVARASYSPLKMRAVSPR